MSSVMIPYLPTMEQKSMNLWKYCRDLDRSNIRNQNLRQCSMDRFERAIVNTKKSLEILESIYLTLQQKKYILHHNEDSMPTSVHIDNTVVPEYDVNNSSSTFDPSISAPPNVEFSKVQNVGGAAVISKDNEYNYLSQLIQNQLAPVYKRLDDIQEQLKDKTEDVKEDAKNAVKSVINTVQEIVNPPEPIVVEDDSVVEPVKESIVSKATSVFKPVEREKKAFMHEMHLAADECVKDIKSGKHGNVEDIEYVLKSAELIRDWIGCRFSKDNLSMTGFDVKNFPSWIIAWIAYFSENIGKSKFYGDKSSVYNKVQRWLLDVKTKQCKYNIPREVHVYCTEVNNIHGESQVIFDKLISIILPYFEPVFLNHVKLILDIDRQNLSEFTCKWSFSTPWISYYYLARIVDLKLKDEFTSNTSINDILSGVKLDGNVWYFCDDEEWNFEMDLLGDKDRFLELLHR